MQYEVTGIINVDPKVQLRLEEAMYFSSPSGIRITVSSTDDGGLEVKMTLEADKDDAAQEMAVVELRRVCNLLRYFYFEDVPISGSRITRTVNKTVTPEGRHVKNVEMALPFYALTCVRKVLDPKSAQQWAYRLGKEYPSDFEEVIDMWGEAVSTNSAAMMYLLLYRLMEFLFDGNTGKLTKWIRDKEPTVQMVRDRNGEITVYTHLRHCIHPRRTKSFPFEDIQNLLPRFLDLVKQRIEEKFAHVHLRE